MKKLSKLERFKQKKPRDKIPPTRVVKSKKIYSRKKKNLVTDCKD